MPRQDLRNGDFGREAGIGKDTSMEDVKAVRRNQTVELIKMQTAEVNHTLVLMQSIRKLAKEDKSHHEKVDDHFEERKTT